jgi:hypothetical protein
MIAPSRDPELFTFIAELSRAYANAERARIGLKPVPKPDYSAIEQKRVADRQAEADAKCEGERLNQTIRRKK